jgi:hypothetical protein
MYLWDTVSCGGGEIVVESGKWFYYGKKQRCENWDFVAPQALTNASVWSRISFTHSTFLLHVLWPQSKLGVEIEASNYLARASKPSKTSCYERRDSVDLTLGF